MNVEGEVGEVLRQYGAVLGRGGRAEPLRGGAGLSGAEIWRVTACDGRTYCLRRWPVEHPSRERLALIHAVLRFVAPRISVLACPLEADSGATFVEPGERFWELSRWLPGSPAWQAPAGRGRVRAAMQVLAQFHNTAAKFSSSWGPAPALADRQRLLAAAKQHDLEAIGRAMVKTKGVGFDAALGEAFHAAGELLARDDVWSAMQQVPPLPLIPAIRDIHRDHVLFEGDEVSGVIDFGALRVDTPLTDIARLVGSLVGDDFTGRKTAFDDYAEVRQLTAEDRRLVDWLDRSGQLGAALNWLRWIYLEQRRRGDSDAVGRRLAEIAGRLRFWLNQPVAR